MSNDDSVVGQFFDALADKVRDLQPKPEPTFGEVMAEQVRRMAGPDTDGDGATDLAEREDGTDPLRDERDPDMDGLDNHAERQRGSSPYVFDSDFDGSPDGAEVRAGRNPTGPEFDSSDVGAWDRMVLAANDSDADGVPDDTEAYAGTDPNMGDTDRDGIEDGLELTVPELSPLQPDSDGDGYLDGRAHDISDNDGDGLTNVREAVTGTHPDVWDTDRDGIADGLEVERGTDPVAWLDPADDDTLDDVIRRSATDPDLDGLTTEIEGWYGTDPAVGDTDAGGVWDGAEVVRGSDPTSVADDALEAVEAAADGVFDGL